MECDLLPFYSGAAPRGESAATEGLLTHAGRQIATLQIESEFLYFRKHYGVIGVLAAAFLATVGDVMKACVGLVRRLDTAQAAAALLHAWTVIKLLVDTRLASRAIR
jgi:N-acetylglucosaminyl-diphospho-decaprenol L-rhamnosyltransferase